MAISTHPIFPLDEGTSITEDSKISDQDHANISGFENAEKSHP
jgi:hypothetical protein